MKILLFVIISFCSIIGIAQKRYTIIYDNGEKLLINDSVSYQYSFRFFGKIKPPLGKRFLMHSAFKNIETKEVLSQSQPYNQRKYLIIDTLPDLMWQIENESKII